MQILSHYHHVYIVCCIFAPAMAAGLSFTGFKQYRLIPTSAEAVTKIRWLSRQFPPDPNPNAGLTFLTLPGQKFETVDLLVPPAVEPQFLTAVRSTGAVRIRLLHRNYGRLIAEFNRQNMRSRWISDSVRRQRRQAADGDAQRQPRNLTLSHHFYRTFQEIRLALVQLKDRCNQILPGTCQLKTIGKTYYNNSLIVLRISKQQTSGKKSKIWIDGGIHAREWISPATVLFVADQLISNLASNSSRNANIVNNHEVMLLPMYNPDGYEYSRIQNRMWRKNREPTNSPYCRGVDLNRNYGYKWGGRASVGAPCAITYRGTAAFSASETAAVKRFLESEKTGLILFLSFHSYGQCILMPYGYMRGTYSNTHLEKMKCAASSAVYSMYAINSRSYTYGTGSDLMYEANGGSDDWAHGTAKIPYSFTIELPDDGDYGFLLPASEVLPVGSEVTAGLSALLDTIRRLEAGDSLLEEEVCRGWTSR